MKAGNSAAAEQSQFLIFAGAVMFLGWLVQGLLIPNFTNVRMALTAHSHGVAVSTATIVLGLIWSRVNLGPKQARIAFWLALYAAFIGPLGTAFSAAFGAGAKFLPISGKGFAPASPLVEAVSAAMTITFSLAHVAAFALVVWGLYPRRVLLQEAASGSMA